MRKGSPKKRILSGDPRYNDPLITRFVNNMMEDGKKELSFKTFYNSLEIVKEKTKEDPHEVWKKALANVMPSVEVMSRRIGGATFQIPAEVRPERKVALGMKWLIGFARKRNGRTMTEKLSAEIIAAANGEGSAVKKKDDTHRMAEANKAFSHFRF